MMQCICDRYKDHCDCISGYRHDPKYIIRNSFGLIAVFGIPIAIFIYAWLRLIGLI